MVSVKLVKLGAKTEEYNFDHSPTVEELFDLAEENFVSGAVTRNNVTVEKHTILLDGDRIYLGSAIKGNIPFEVNFRRFGSSSINLPAEDGYTIKQTLDQLDQNERQNFYRADGKSAYEFRVSNNGQPVDENYVLRRPEVGDTLIIMCTQRVKGNEIIE